MAKKLLIIDDNEQDQKIMKRFLAQIGLTDIDCADTGEKGVQEAASSQYDIILLDTMLPGIDGFETCHQIKKVKKVNSKVIMMTGRVDAVDAGKARKMGADDYCVKTSDCSVVIESVKKFI